MSSSAYSPLLPRDPEEPPRGLSVPPERVVRQRVGRPSHGIVLLLHTVFKLFALLVYLVTVHSFITTFILGLLLLSADFWIVKNVSGRLLAGLRWWSVVDEEGKVQNIIFLSYFSFSVSFTLILVLLWQLKWKYESWSAEERAMAQQGEVCFTF
jgi:hypothetical protein